MEKDWVKIMTDTSPAAINILQARLEEEGIHAVVINKRDQSYQLFGELELYVHQSQAARALAIIQAPSHE